MTTPRPPAIKTRPIVTSEWEPEEGLQRNAFTVAANILTAIGFALLLTGVYAIRGRQVMWREGLLWGLAGFVVFTAAPGLGLPPELPGMAVAELTARQTWWIATAAATAGGLCLLAFRPAAWARGCWPRFDRAAASDRCPTGAGIAQRGSCHPLPSIYRRRNADQPVVLGAARRRHQPGLRTNFRVRTDAINKFDFHFQRPGFCAYSVSKAELTISGLGGDLSAPRRTAPISSRSAAGASPRIPEHDCRGVVVAGHAGDAGAGADRSRAKLDCVSYAPFRTRQTPGIRLISSARNRSPRISPTSPRFPDVSAPIPSTTDWTRCPSLLPGSGLKVILGIWLGRDRVKNALLIDTAIAVAENSPRRRSRA